MRRVPAEDFALAARSPSSTPKAMKFMVEATNSWAYVGAGLRASSMELELLGPEYSMEFSSLNTGLKIFLSREVRGGQGEDLVEKQNTEQGLMPVVENEADIYGYVGENRHMVDAFRHRRQPIEFPRRRRRRRNADGTLSLGRNRAGGHLPVTGPGDLCSAGSAALI